MRKIRNIHIFGPQGAGKDTQSIMLAKKRKVPFIVMGELFRREARKKSKIGKKIHKIMETGNLVTDEITLKLIEKKLSNKSVKKGYVLNGFPRNKKQVIAGEKISNIDLVIELKISDKEALRRISGRRICSKCGSTFHIIYNPPKKKGTCDNCHRKLTVRSDDKPKMIKNRLKIYHHKTEPLFKYYKKKGIYLAINGERTIPKVFQEISKKIKQIEK